jgi:hypothetical protein
MSNAQEFPSLPPLLPWLQTAALLCPLHREGTACAAAQQVPSSSCTFSVPTRGYIESLEDAPSVQELQELLESAMEAVSALAQAQPQIEGLDKMKKRVQRDLQFVAQCTKRCKVAADTVIKSSNTDGNTADDLEPAKQPILTLERVQGIINNLRGFEGEIQAATLCPG